MQANQTKHSRMFIRGLSPITNDRSLGNYFSRWGDLMECRVVKDPNTMRSRVFAFITFKDPDSVDHAQDYRPHIIDGQEVDTKRAMPYEEARSEQSVTNMFVGGLKDNTTEEMVRDCFYQYGNITEVNMITHKGTGKTRGFCFVTFDDYDPVDKCVLIKYHTYDGQRWYVEKAWRGGETKEQTDDSWEQQTTGSWEQQTTGSWEQHTNNYCDCEQQTNNHCDCEQQTDYCEQKTEDHWQTDQGLGMNRCHVVRIPGVGMAYSHMQATMKPVYGGFLCSWAQINYSIVKGMMA